MGRCRLLWSLLTLRWGSFHQTLLQKHQSGSSEAPTQSVKPAVSLRQHHFVLLQLGFNSITHRDPPDLTRFTFSSAGCFTDKTLCSSIALDQTTQWFEVTLCITWNWNPDQIKHINGCYHADRRSCPEGRSQSESNRKFVICYFKCVAQFSALMADKINVIIQEWQEILNGLRITTEDVKIQNINYKNHHWKAKITIRFKAIS